MPNAPKTPTRTFRIPDEIWSDMNKLAKEKNTTVSAIVVELLRNYVAENKTTYGEW